MNKKLTKQQEIEIHNRVQWGDSVTQISKDFGISRQHIYRLGKKVFVDRAENNPQIMMALAPLLEIKNKGYSKKYGKKVIESIELLEDILCPPR